MANYWIVVDVSSMAYAALAVLGKLTHEGAATGVIYGVATRLQSLAEQYDTQNIVACFDGGHTARSQMLPGYKSGRVARRLTDPPEKQQARAELTAQLAALRTTLLPSTGLTNILWMQGYEADDLIAGAVDAIPLDDYGTIISTDEDLWQCIRPGVFWDNGKAKVSYKSFQTQWGILPNQWPQVKAWAGCTSDDIPGVDGVGDKIAAKYLAGTLPPHYKIYGAFADNVDTFTRNMPLVKLPIAGMPPVVLKPQDKRIDWNPLLHAIGAKTNGQTKAQGIATQDRGFGLHTNS